MLSPPVSPKLQKGAIVAVEGSGPAKTILTFQYNPETLSRSVKPRWMQDASKAEVFRLSGAPEEEIKVDIELDASDGLEVAEPNVVAMGVFPQLSALETIVYPKSDTVKENNARLQNGTLEIVPASGPLTLFVYGQKRVLPVKIMDISITEELHDPNLNPIRAKVSLTMKVLSYNDLPSSHQGYGMFQSHHVAKEDMARKAQNPSGQPGGTG